MTGRKIVALDQGTTSTRALRFDGKGVREVTAARPLSQHYPQAGWVEHDPEEIWQSSLAVLRDVIDDDVCAIGITNQRETVLLWDRASGHALHPAIVWQDRRTAKLCDDLRADGYEPMVRAKTGLLLDPYFSATKLRWLLDSIPGARERAARGELAAGTVDCFLLWRLTGGKIHATDITNASRTLLFDISALDWDDALLDLFAIPRSLLPTVHDNAHLFGETSLFGRPVPIAGMAGDQQAAMIGQSCFTKGQVKSTFGTGCFMLAHIGDKPILSEHRLLTSPAYRIDSETSYALEGSIFVAGAAIGWLRDGLRVIDDVAETAAMAASLPADHGVTLVPAFVGLGAPHWRSDLRAAIFGLTFDSGPAHLVRATLESVAFQSVDLIEAMGLPPSTLRIDGGMAGNDWFAQFLADMLGVPVERPSDIETTARGAACLAGLTVGLWPDLETLARHWRAERRFEPKMAAEQRLTLLRGWRAALAQLS